MVIVIVHGSILKFVDDKNVCLSREAFLVTVGYCDIGILVLFHNGHLVIIWPRKENFCLAGFPSIPIYAF